MSKRLNLAQSLGLSLTSWLIDQTDFSLALFSFVTGALALSMAGVSWMLLYQERYFIGFIFMLVAWFFLGFHVHIELAHMTKIIKDEFDLTPKGFYGKAPYKKEEDRT